MEIAPTPISVIIPTYNRYSVLKRSIDSVLAQTYSNLEVIVVDDSSTDETMDLLSQIHDTRLRVHPLKKRSGQSVARNVGANLASYPYLAFQDSDDVWHEDKLETQLRHWHSGDPDHCGASVTQAAQKMGDLGEKIRPEWTPSQPERLTIDNFLGGSIVSIPTLIVRKELFDSVGGFNSSLRRYEGWDLSLRLGSVSDFDFCPEVLVDNYRTPSSASSQADYQSVLHIVSNNLAAYKARSNLTRDAADWLWYAGARLLMQGHLIDGKHAWQCSTELAPDRMRLLIRKLDRLQPKMLGTLVAATLKIFDRALTP